MRHNLSILALLAFLPIACAPNLGHDDYSTDNPGELSSRFVMGTIIESQQVTIRNGDKGQRAVAGGTGGALVGSLLGAAIGSGSNNTNLGAGIGILAGGLGGAVLGGATSKSKAWRIIAKTDDGEMIASVSTQKLYAGTRVRVEIPLSGGRVRFVPVNHL